MQQFINNLSSNPYYPMFFTIAAIIIFDVIFIIWNLVSIKNFIKNASKTNAQVVDAEMVQKGKSRYLELSLLFKDEMNTEISKKISTIKKYQKGDVVEIFYNKNDSQDVRLNNPTDLYLMVWIVTGAIFAMAVIAVIIALQY